MEKQLHNTQICKDHSTVSTMTICNMSQNLHVSVIQPQYVSTINTSTEKWEQKNIHMKNEVAVRKTKQSLTEQIF